MNMANTLDVVGAILVILVYHFILMDTPRKNPEIAFSKFKEDMSLIYSAPIIAIGMMFFGLYIMMYLASLVASTRLKVISNCDKVISRLILIVFCIGFVFINMKLINDYNILADHLDKLHIYTLAHNYDRCYLVSSKTIQTQSSKCIDATYEHSTGLTKSVYYKIDTTDMPNFVDCWVYNQNIYLREVREIVGRFKHATFIYFICYLSNTLIVILSILEILCTSESKYMCSVFGTADPILVRNKTYKIARERNLIHHYQGLRSDCNLIM